MWYSVLYLFAKFLRVCYVRHFNRNFQLVEQITVGSYSFAHQKPGSRIKVHRNTIFVLIQFNFEYIFDTTEIRVAALWNGAQMICQTFHGYLALLAAWNIGLIVNKQSDPSLISHSLDRKPLTHKYRRYHFIKNPYEQFCSSSFERIHLKHRR